LIQAIDLALADEWEQAHKIVQNIENKSTSSASRQAVTVMRGKAKGRCPSGDSGR
jgi:hypothetical protein